MATEQIANDVYWIGVRDPELAVFDIFIETKSGTTYNSYLVKGEKTVLIDGVKKQFEKEWFDNIEKVLPVDKIDFLIVNHTEPDHSGSLKELLKRNPNLKIYCAAPAMPFVKNVLNQEIDLEGIKDNFELDLGGRKLTFKLTPYMHWPDTMMEFLDDAGILFSCDGFASHLSMTALFDDELVDGENLEYEYKYYYDNIMRPFAGYIRRNMPKLDEFDIKMIAPSHGPILRTDPRSYIDKYVAWTAEKYDRDIAVFYTSNYGNTARLAEKIVNELNDGDLKVESFEITETDAAKARDILETSRAVAIGTPTFNGDSIKPVWDLVGLFSTVYSIGKKAAVFGSYGWGGEGIKLVADRLAGLKLKVYENQYRARLVPSDDEMTELQSFTSGFADFVGPAK